MIQKFKNSNKFFHQENRESERNFYKTANFSSRNFFENNLSYHDNYNDRYSETWNFHTPTNFHSEVRKTSGGYFVSRKFFFQEKTICKFFFFCLAEILFSNRQKDQSANPNHFFTQNANANNFFSQKHVSPIRMNNNNNAINNNNFLHEKQMHFYPTSAPPNIFAASNFQNFKINNERTQIEEEPQTFFQNNNNKPQTQLTPPLQTFFQNNFFVAPGQNNNQLERNNNETTNLNMNVMNNLNPNNTNTNNNFNAILNDENVVINRNQIFAPEDQEKVEIKHFEENSFLRRQNEGDDQSVNFLKLTASANDEEENEFNKSSPAFNQTNANFFTFSERAPPMMNYNVPGNS